MTPFVETPSDTASFEAPEEPSRRVVRARPGFATGPARIFYAVLSSALAASVLVQVFFAGMGAFGADWTYHVTFAHFLAPLPMLMAPAAFFGRLPWALRLLPLGLVILIGTQYAFAHTTIPAAALHPVNGFLILLTSLFIARRAWATWQRKG